MKILLVNKFLYHKGGDAISTLTTRRILEAHGHEVEFWGMDHLDKPSYPFQEYFVSNVDYNSANGLTTGVRTAMNILYSFEVKKKIDAPLDQIKPNGEKGKV